MLPPPTRRKLRNATATIDHVFYRTIDPLYGVYTVWSISCDPSEPDTPSTAPTNNQTRTDFPVSPRRLTVQRRRDL